MQLSVSTETGSDCVHLQCHINSNNELKRITCALRVNEGMDDLQRQCGTLSVSLIVLEDSVFLWHKLRDCGSTVHSFV